MAAGAPGTAQLAVGLRPWAEADAAELAAMYAAARDAVMVEEPWVTEAFFTVRGQRERIARCGGDPAAEGFVITVSTLIAGHLSLDGIAADVLRSADLGYWVAPRWRRLGLATEAVALAAEQAFDRLGLDRLHATVSAGNPPSWRVLERNGFQRVGTFADPGDWSYASPPRSIARRRAVERRDLSRSGGGHPSGPGDRLRSEPAAPGAARNRRAAPGAGVSFLYQLTADRWRAEHRAGPPARRQRRPAPGR